MGNGGYYPLQVRTLLERGELAFPDMPLLFYIDAGIVRLFTIFGTSISNELIINIVKVVDSVSIPLLLLPLYQILKLSKKKNFSFYILSCIALSVLSFQTLNLTSSFQKNSLAITILFFSIAWFVRFLTTRSRKHFIIAVTFFVLIGLTHFGTFTFALLAGTIYLVFRYKKKAVFPIVGLIILALLLIYQFDPVRFSRLLLSWKGLFSKLPNPSQIVLTLTYLIIAFFAIRTFRKFKETFNRTDRAIILTLIALLIIIPFPIIDPQAASRLSAFLFIPVILLLIKFDPIITILSKKLISILLATITLGSISFFLIMRPPADVNKEALEDLYKMQPYMTEPDHTVVVSRHNLEFWVAWALEVDVSQESKFNDTLISEYNEIFIINQIREVDSRIHPENNGKEEKRNHFDEPLIPVNSTLVYSSEYFKLYQYNKNLEVDKK